MFFKNSDRIYYRVQCRARAHRAGRLLEVRAVVAADVLRFALRGDKLRVYLRFVLGKRLCGLGEARLKVLVLGLLGQGLGPVQGEVEVAAPVVELAYLAGWRPVEVEYLAVSLVERIGQYLGLGVLEVCRHVFKGDSE